MPDLTPEALAAELEELARSLFRAFYDTGQRGGPEWAAIDAAWRRRWLASARTAMDRLAPAHAALAAERDAALKTVSRWQGENQRLIAGRDEMAARHKTLLGEILRNADEDIRNADEAPEYLAEAWVRFLEADRDQLARRVAAARRPMDAEDLAPVLYEAWFAALAGSPWEAATWSELTPALSAAWRAATHEALRITVADLRQAAELIAAQDDRARYRAALEAARETLQHIALGDAPPHKASVAADKAAVKIREALEGGQP